MNSIMTSGDVILRFLKYPARYFFAVILIFALLVLGSCQRDRRAEEKQEIKTVFFPSFSGDSAYNQVAAQVAFGPRVVNTKAHDACADYLMDMLSQYCDTVLVQAASAVAWNGEILNFRNIIGVFNPENPSRVFIAAHWDARPYADHDADPAFHRTPIDGANDGASGVGVILELARIMSLHPAPQGIDLILFDAEDYGEPQDTERTHMNNWGLGSQHWSTQPHLKGYRARYGILLDMVGVTDPNFTWEGTSHYYAPDILAMVWNKAAKVGYSSNFSREETPAIVDDHYFINEKAKIPTINIIHHDPASASGFFKHWHTRLDNIENVDPKSLQMVGDVMIRVIYDPL